MSGSDPAEWMVRHARAEELPLLGAIEDEAGSRFNAIPELAGVPEVSSRPEAFARAVAENQVWVAVADGAVIGFAYAEPVDGCSHLEEIDVLPAWGRRGVGRALIAAVIADARVRGLAGVTLTTFRDVSWNAPFYATLGFRVLDAAQLTPGLAAIVAEESVHGLPAALRVVMRLDL